MNICHIIVGLNVGGAELMLKKLIKAHEPGMGFRHSVISLTSVGPVGAELQSLGVEVQAIHMRDFLDIPRTIWRLTRLLRERRPDIVQTWMYHADLLGGLAARLNGCRNIIWGIRTTDIGTGNSRATSCVRWLCARLSSWIPRVIVCAAESSRRAHIKLGYDRGRMAVVSNGFDLTSLRATPSQTANLRAECGFEADALVFGTLGRFNIVKDQRNFVLAAALIAKDNPKVNFLLVGRDCDSANVQLAEWIAATGISSRFVLLGERSDAPICLAAMDVFCLSSRTEGFPNAVGEAMAMGKPCVVTDVGDSAYLIGDCGVVVPKQDEMALSMGMLRILKLSNQARRALGERARARIASNFTIEQTRMKFEDIYSKCSR